MPIHRPPMQISQKPKSHTGRWVGAGVLVLAVIAGMVNYLRPLPEVSATLVHLKQSPAQQVHVNFPAYGQASLALGDGTLLATSGAQVPLATASLAKVVASLCILEKYPLAVGQEGPSITLTAQDVANYDAYVAQNGSVAKVQAGEVLTERQLLEGMMLPSANNLADTGAIWAYGSLAAYSAVANEFLAKNGMTQTHIGVDASGLDPSTKSTATDIAKLGSLALKQPALMQIVGESSAVLPVAGTVHNYDTVLGQEGIIGMKTGNSDYDTGAFLYAARVPVGDTTQIVTGAVMGAATLSQALHDSVTVVASAKANFSMLTVAERGKVLGTYHAPWGATADAVASASVKTVRWNGQNITPSLALKKIKADTTTGTSVGTVSAGSSHGTVQLNTALTGPSFWWRLTRL